MKQACGLAFHDINIITQSHTYIHRISTATKSNTVKCGHYGTGIHVYCSANKWDDDASLSNKKSYLCTTFERIAQTQN